MLTKSIDVGAAIVAFKVDFDKYPLLAGKTMILNFSAAVEKQKITKMISLTFIR